jgi:hypothetical protein
MELLADSFCARGAMITTDQFSGYFVPAQEWEHHFVNHSREFQSKDGLHTNLAENYFSRMRACQAGAWHRLTVRFLEEYAWEVAWRLTMLPHSNLYQLQDLLTRLLSSGRTTRFRDSWNKQRRKSKAPPEAADDQAGYLVEIPKDKVRKRRGPPRTGVVRVKPPAKEKRAYRRRAKEVVAEASAPLSPIETTPETPPLPADAVTKSRK